MKKLLRDDYLRQSGIVLFFSMVTTMANYLYQVFCNRTLTPNEFGLLNSLLSTFAITVSMLSPVSQWLVKIFSESKHYSSRYLISIIFKKYYFTTFIVFIVLLVFSSFFKNNFYSYFKTESYYLLLGIMTLGFVHAAIVPLSSIFTGFGNFKFRGITTFTNDIILLLMIVLLSFFSMNDEKALLIKIFALLFSLVTAFLLGKKSTRTIVSNEEFTSQYLNLNSFLKTGFGVVLLMFIIHVDMIVARIVMNPSSSGIYATISIFGKALFFFSTLTAPVFYTKCIEAHNSKISPLPVILKGLLFAIISILISLVGLYLFLNPFVKILNPAYVKNVPMILDYAISMIPYVLIFFLVNFLIVYERHKIFYLFLVIAVLQIVFLTFSKGDLVASFIENRLYFGLIHFIYLFIYIFIIRSKNKNI